MGADLVFKLKEFLYISIPILAPDIQMREQAHIILEGFYLLFTFSWRFKNRWTKHFLLVSVDVISYEFHFLHKAFSDEVVKLQLIHFMCMIEVVYNSWLCDLLFKWIPKVFHHINHLRYIFLETFADWSVSLGNCLKSHENSSPTTIHCHSVLGLSLRSIAPLTALMAVFLCSWAWLMGWWRMSCSSSGRWSSLLWIPGLFWDV